MEIRGKTAIITGGASGLGAATVKRLYRLGANTVIADINSHQAEELVRALNSKNVVFSKVDVTNTKQVQTVIERAVTTFKGVHILVNCAGTALGAKTVGKDGPHDLEIFKKIININLIGTFDFIRHSAFHMQKNSPNENGERGVIVNCSSIAAFDGQIGQVAYTASKAGVAGMTLAVARDLGPSGIRCCTIAPGAFDTPLMDMMPEPVKTQLKKVTPFPNRLGKSEEFAQLVQHIVENAFLNGEVIRLDGAIRMPPK